MLCFFSRGVVFMAHCHIIKCPVYWQELRFCNGPLDVQIRIFFNFIFPFHTSCFLSLPSSLPVLTGGLLSCLQVAVTVSKIVLNSPRSEFVFSGETRSGSTLWGLCPLVLPSRSLSGRTCISCQILLKAHCLFCTPLIQNSETY